MSGVGVEYCGVDLGTAVPPSCVWLTGTTVVLRMGTITTDFDVCQACLNYPVIELIGHKH